METYTPKTAQEYLELFLKRKKLFFALSLNVLLAALLVYPFLPRFYEAAALIQVGDERVANPHMKGLTVEPKSEGTLKTITAEILSFPHMAVLAKELGRMDEGTSKMKQEKIVAGLRRHIKVTVVSESLIQIAFEDKEAKKAQAGANAIADFLVDTHRKARQDQARSAVSFIEQQLRIYKEKLKNAEQTFLLNKVSSQLEELTKKRNMLSEQMSQTVKTVTTSVNRQGNPAASQIRKELAMAEAQLNRLLVGAKKEHPMAKELRIRIETLRRQLNLEPEELVSSETNTTNPEYHDLSREVKELDMEIDSFNKKQDELMSGKFVPKGISEQDLLAIESDKRINEDVYQSLLRRLESAHIAQHLDEMGQGGNFLVIDPARIPLRPAKPNPLVVAAASVFLAAFSGIGVVLIKEYFDSSFRGYSDAKDYLKQPVLACVPTLLAVQNGNATVPLPPEKRNGKNGKEMVYLASAIKDSTISPEIVAYHDPNSVPAEQYRLFRTHFLFINEKRPVKTLMVTSALEAEGKTTTSVNVAVSMANELSGQVLLMDCDLRRGGVGKKLGCAAGIGLSNFLESSCPLEAILKPTKIDGLTVIGAGPTPTASPTRLLSSDRMRKLMDVLRAKYDTIIIDAPPVLHLADVPVLTLYADGIVMVVQVGKTPRELVTNAQTTLEQAHRVNVLGYILTHVDHVIPPYIHHYLKGGR
ncbi:MAG: polysaccharide biosynthesis tyrosine autokinase [Elusimicrobia bacterium]|nr:polysaccharide biosynthesis tyrosine autokinase [Elusimicrobiota bacterium]